VFAWTGLALVLAGITAALVALVSWWPCVEGRAQQCLDLQYVANPTLDPVVHLWFVALPVTLVMFLVGIWASTRQALRWAGILAVLAVAVLNILTDYVLTVGGSADSGPGFGIPMSVGVALAGVALLVGGLRARSEWRRETRALPAAEGTA
jgi:hypothetical protein